MNPKYALTTFAVVLAACAGHVQAADWRGVYLEARGGNNSPFEATAEDAFVGGGAVGVKTKWGFRPEFEVTHRKNQLQSRVDGGLAGFLYGTGYIRETTVLANLNYDFDTGTRFVPYIGAGAGFVMNSHKVNYRNAFLQVRTDDKDATFAYQVGAGAAYNITDHMAFTLGYRFLATTPSNTGLNANGNLAYENDRYKAREVLAGLRYSF